MSPTRAQPVVIHLPDAQDLAARVEASTDRVVTLVLSVHPDARLGRSPAVVEYHTPTGIHRIAGSLGSDGADASVLHLERQGGEEVEQRREFARVDADVRVAVRSAADRAATVALNISAKGALIQDPVGLPLGTPVVLALELDGTTIRATGRVAREAGADLKGIELDEIADADRERIVRYVQARQLLELRLRRARERR